MKRGELWAIFTRSMRVMDRRLLPYLSAIFFMSTSFALFSVMEGLLMKAIVDIAQSGAYEHLLPTIAGIVLCGVVSLLIFRRSAIVYNVEAKRVYGVLSERVLETAVSLPYRYYETHHSGEILSKISYDLDKMGAIYGSRLRRVVMPLLQVIVFLIPMLWMDARLTLCLVGVNALLLLLDILTVKPLHRIRRRLSEQNREMTGILSDLLQGMEQVRMNRAGAEYAERFKRSSHRYAGLYRGQIGLGTFLESAEYGFHLLSTLFFLMVGVYFVSRGYSTLGGLAAIYTIYRRFSEQFLMLGKYIPELIGCLANAEHIFSFLAEERETEPAGEEESAAAERETAAGDEALPVVVERLRFSYEPGREVLRGLSFAVRKGECVALTGASGCGKTTLSKLLLGLYPIEDAGAIRLYGRTLGETGREALRREIAYVPQEAFLFSGTIRENIRYGRVEATEEEIREAARLANADGFIRTLPDGYDTVIYERGRNLSGGQRQRIAIARALLKGAGLLLLDEATSALDQESERLINETIDHLRGRQTVLMIAHRPSTIALADRVVDVDK